MATNDNVTNALAALVALLQTTMPSPQLDDIDIMLNGTVENGAPTAAMDRRLRRNLVASRIATDSAAAPDRAARFPNADRLGR